MSAQKIILPSGTRIEFWARSKTHGIQTFSIVTGDQTLFATPNMSKNWEYYEYRHREDSTVTVHWDEMNLEVSFAYVYQVDTVNQLGVELWQFGEKEISRLRGDALATFISSDQTRPQLHFSPPLRWMNDPNGLCKIADTWHMFYQFHPNGTDWGPMHWGHATSKDLFNWTHLPVFLQPAQNLTRLGATGGAFSGNAFRDRDGSLSFYYTERLPAYDLFKGYREVQKRAWPDANLIKANQISDVLEDRPAGVQHDFRDPKVWWDETARAYRMVLGASINQDPAVLLYGSADGQNWSYLSPLYRAPSGFKMEGARAVECPDFFPLDGKWVLIMGFVGHTEPETGRHNLLYALVGDFINDEFVPTGDELQLLDFGTDYYAMQSFEADGRQLAFAWLFNWEFRKPGTIQYSGEMSLPRELFLDDRKQLCMKPAQEFETACSAVPLNASVDGTFAIDDEAFEIDLSENLEGTLITATQADNFSFSVSVKNGVVEIKLPQDDGKIKYSAAVAGANDLRLFHDRGIIEIFAAGGAVCGTRRNYTNIAPDRFRVVSQAGINVFARKLKN